MPGIVEPELLEEPEPAPVEQPTDNTPARPYVLFGQHVELEIDFREKRVHGRSHILVVPIEPVSEVYIDARHCEIDVEKITVSNCPAKASYKDLCDAITIPDAYQWSAPQWPVRKRRMEPLLHHRRKEVPVMAHDMACCQPLDGSLRVTLPSADEVKDRNRDAPKSDQQELLIHADGAVKGYRISIPFELKNVYNGLHFVGVDEGDTRYPHVYTHHSVEPGTACSIFPCIDDPGCRNPWKISITCPRTLGDALHRPLTARQRLKNTTTLNGNRKRKLGEEEPTHRERDYSLTEEDKQLEMTVVCSGFLTGESINKDDETKKTMTFEVENNKAAKHIGFAIGPFEHVDLWSEFRSEEDDTKLGVSAAKVHGYCLPGRAEEVRNTCAALVTAVDHFVLHFGRYPFENYKVCFIDDMVEDTTPLCAFSLCSNRLLYPSDIVDTEIETTRTLVYSLASQWFGVNIVPNTKADIWLVVGIAWFMTDYFMKALCGNNTFRFRMKTMADRLVEIDVKRPSLQDLGEHLYLGSFEADFMNLKAPLVLFILDRRLAKSSGSAGISRIISRMVSKANTTHDDVLPSDSFRKACEKVGSTRLESFWNQWVVGSGCPRFDVFQRFNKKKLCVEMTVRQTQDIAAAKVRPIDKNEFWRDVREETHAVYAGELQQAFTGPMTIRIHEADGTPYEHIVEIREDGARSVRFEIPYNTKYKRLKRNRRQRERALANNNAKEEGQKELYYLGDVMQHPDDVEEWGFRDWDEETEAKMDQESYEWIRMDADFEWICEMKTNLPAYMYASQLQQDRDVAAQQDSMLFLKQSFAKSGAHPLVSTILTRTLLDPRYFYGIRLMAAEELPRHAVQEQVDWIGFRHLQKTFQHMFCYPGSTTPRPNNFSDKRQYMIQCAIPEAMARIRGEDGKCPKEARRFILGLLQHNNNSENVFSDQFYICKLIRAVAVCQLPDEKKSKPQMAMSLSFGDGDNEDEIMADAVDTEPEEFRDLALEEIERYRRRDEYAPSFQNCFTVASLDALCLLMKAGVIPLNPLTFAQYLQDKTCDTVRIKACESLVEVGLLDRPEFLRFFFALISTDPSPFVRDQLFKVLCRGLASIAIGERPESNKQAPEPVKEGLDLVVEQENSIMEERQKAKARREDLHAALAALKEQTEDNDELQEAIWRALDSPVLSVAERINLLETCSLLVTDDPALTLKFAYPEVWSASCVRKIRGESYVLKFTKSYRTKTRGTYVTQAPPPPSRPEPKRTITLNLNKPAVSTPTQSQPPVAPSPAPTLPSAPISTPVPAQPKKSISVTVPKSHTDSPTPIVKVAKQTTSNATPTAAKPATKPAAKSTIKSAIKSTHKHTPKPTTKPALKPPAPPEKAVKNGEPRRDSISVLPPIRPTIEPPQPEPKIHTPKPAHVNGNLTVKTPKSLKRASTESESNRPSKIVKLDTKKILPQMKKLQPQQKLVTVKFNAWDRLNLSKDSQAPVTIRAAGKKPKSGPEKNSTAKPDNLLVSGNPRSSAAIPNRTHNATSSPRPQPRSSTPTSTSHPPASSQSGGGSGGKPRKPLPDMMRKPLPSATANPHTTPSKPSSASAPIPKPLTKLKIKVKNPS
ncbi:putative transcription initiation factor tfiid 127kd subunit [Rosellinia necatrix]|uniref:Transcription initiation factor TFIID subunit 2 n=1 Tax=Rosellinia necatrix TaxID=77044 RepID=A0A1W2TBR1_ROSNE|nr:putative transcription initiation factor tfiid 127kd subunit [Rosellinia necatrix]